MAGSISKEALLKILGENKDALAKLEEVTVKADELKTENPTLTVEIDAAKARAEAALLKAELKRELGSIDVTVKPDVSQFRLLMDKAAGFLTANPLTASSGGGGGILSSVGAVATSSPEGLAVVAGAAASAVTEVLALTTGLTAATAGVGALALVALPTFDAIKTGLADTPKQLAKLPAPIQDAVHGIDNLKGGFDKLALSMQPQVLGILNTGLGIAAQFLPVIGKFAEAAAPAVEAVMKSLSKSVSSAGFKTFTDALAKISPGAITSIGDGIIMLTTRIGLLLERFTRGGAVINAFKILFGTLDGVMIAVTWAIGAVMTGFDVLWSELKTFGRGIKEFATAAGRDLANWAQVVDNIFGNVNNWFNVTLPTGIATAISWFQQLPGKILSAIGNLGGLLVKAGEDLIGGLVSGIKSAAGGILHSALSWVTSLIPSWKGPMSVDEALLRPSGLAIMRGLVYGIGDGTAALQSTLSGVTRTISTGVGGAGGRGGPNVIIQVAGSGNTTFDALMTQWLRKNTRILGGGSVQTAFGKAGM